MSIDAHPGAHSVAAPIADFAGLTREPRSCLGRWPGSGEQHGVSPGSICAAVSVADDRFAVALVSGIDTSEASPCP
jgi:hypothetical protein